MKIKGFVACAALCLLMFFGVPEAHAFTGAPLATLNQTEQAEPMSLALGKLREERAGLLEAQLEVMLQANEAKARIEEILNQKQATRRALSAAQLEALKKDLEVIRANQELLNTVLADIRSAALDQENLMPTREYVQKMILLYREKTEQLIQVASALEGVAQSV